MDAYLINAAVVQYVAQDIRPPLIYAFPNLAQSLYILAIASTSQSHAYTGNMTVNLQYVPRYQVGPGS